MSLIVEDGSNVPGAESYISVADADTYHSNRGNAAWTPLTTTQKEQFLRQATQYMTGMYRLRWKGYRTYITQALDWPRYDVPVEDTGFTGLMNYVPPNTVPPEVTWACAELALRAISGPLAPDLDREVVSEAVGPITTEYRPGARQYVKFRFIDLMLKIYLGPGGSEMRRA